MKKIIGVFLLFSLGACSSVSNIDTKAPRQKLLIDGTVQTMSRQETISASNQCLDGNMKPHPIFARRKIGDSEMTYEVIVDILCVPKY
jgi:hypothetical protein